MSKKRAKSIDPKANKLSQQRGKHILLGELPLALEQHLKVHKLEPQDITLMKTTANLLSLDPDADFELILGECFLQAGNFGVAQAYLLDAIRKKPKMCPAALKLLEELIKRNDLDASLDVVDALFETSMQLQEEMTLKILLDSLLELDKSNIRTLKALTTLLIRINDQLTLEEYLKQLAILQLRSGNIQEARDSLNKMIIYGQNSSCVNLLNLLNDATVMGSPRHLKETCQAVTRALLRGSLGEVGSIAEMELVSGGSDLDLGLGFESKETF